MSTQQPGLTCSICGQQTQRSFRITEAGYGRIRKETVYDFCGVCVAGVEAQSQHWYKVRYREPQYEHDRQEIITRWLLDRAKKAAPKGTD